MSSKICASLTTLVPWRGADLGDPSQHRSMVRRVAGVNPGERLTLDRRVEDTIHAAEVVRHVVIGMFVVEPRLVPRPVAEPVPPISRDGRTHDQRTSVPVERRRRPPPLVELARNTHRITGMTQ